MVAPLLILGATAALGAGLTYWQNRKTVRAQIELDRDRELIDLRRRELETSERVLGLDPSSVASFTTTKLDDINLIIKTLAPILLIAGGGVLLVLAVKK